MKRTLYQVYKDRYRYYYTAALAITGNELTAEEVMLDAITEAGPRASFDRALRLLKRRALENAGEDNGVDFLADSPASGETDEVRRALFLKYALKLNTFLVAQALGVNLQAVRDMLARVRKSPELLRACEKELKKGYHAPDQATFRQMLESCAAEKEEAVSAKPGFMRAVLGVILVLLIGFMVWLGAVMLDYYITAANENVTEVTNADG